MGILKSIPKMNRIGVHEQWSGTIHHQDFNGLSASDRKKPSNELGFEMNERKKKSRENVCFFHCFNIYLTV